MKQSVQANAIHPQEPAPPPADAGPEKNDRQCNGTGKKNALQVMPNLIPRKRRPESGRISIVIDIGFYDVMPDHSLKNLTEVRRAPGNGLGQLGLFWLQ